ncbi:hypothetical protein AAHC03_0517 [Spirometra sp. Aus1]
MAFYAQIFMAIFFGVLTISAARNIPKPYRSIDDLATESGAQLTNCVDECIMKAYSKSFLSGVPALDAGLLRSQYHPKFSNCIYNCNFEAAVLGSKSKRIVDPIAYSALFSNM